MADSDDDPEIQDNDREARVAILELAVSRLREQTALTSSDAAAARLLAAGADHDVSEVRSELRAHTQVLNALRETQLEQGQAITSIRQQLTDQGQAITNIRQELTDQGKAITNIRQDVVSLDQKVSAGFATLHTGMAQIVALLNGKA